MPGRRARRRRPRRRAAAESPDVRRRCHDGRRRSRCRFSAFLIQVPSLRRALHIFSIALLTIVCIGFFLWNSNLHDVWQIIRSTSVPWFVAGLLINFTALIFRTIRWRTLLDVDQKPAFYPTFFANTVGFMLSTVLPIR